MLIQVIEILENHIMAKFDNDIFPFYWCGEKPLKNQRYHTEIEMNDRLVYGVNLKFSDKSETIFKYQNDEFMIVATLNYDNKTQLAYINVLDNIVLVEVTNVNQNVCNEWVELKCKTITLVDINL